MSSAEKDRLISLSQHRLEKGILRNRPERRVRAKQCRSNQSSGQVKRMHSTWGFSGRQVHTAFYYTSVQSFSFSMLVRNKQKFLIPSLLLSMLYRKAITHRLEGTNTSLHWTPSLPPCSTLPFQNDDKQKKGKHWGWRWLIQMRRVARYEKGLKSMEKDTSGTVGQRKGHLFEKILPEDSVHGAPSTEYPQPRGPTHTTLGFHTCCLQY